MPASILLFFIPSFLSFLAAFLIFKGLATPSRIEWWLTGTGIAVLLLVCAFLFVMFVISGLFSVVAILMGLFAAGAMLIAGISAAVAVPGARRKVWVAAITLGYPALMVVSFFAAQPLTFNSQSERQGEAIARALDAYHARTGRYPVSLAQLEPVDMAALPEQTSIGGWLYQTSGDHYLLGFAGDPGEYGYSADIYSSQNHQWDYKKPWENPFRDVIPTTTPTPHWLGPTPSPAASQAAPQP